MADRAVGSRVQWYRSPLSREDLSALNQRSDVLGLLQTGGYLGLLALTGTAAMLSVGRLPWYAVVPLFFFHAACYNFLINGFHELVHDSVFKTKWLNRFFLWIFSFLGWYNHIHFWASHTEHHKFTLHPPDDLEVVLPVQLTLRDVLKRAFINPMGVRWTLEGVIRHARGKLKGEWEEHLFPASDPAKRRKLFNWARFVLVGHGAIVVLAIYFKLYYLPLVITLAPFYGGALHFLCNTSQHIGLRDNVPDFRLCCRTIYLNPFFQFLYWHMNYHIEHHTYAAVPCYRLGKLHRLIKHDLPPSSRGLWATWKEIAAILAKQKADPTYQYSAPLPAGAAPAASAPAADPPQESPPMESPAAGQAAPTAA